LNKSLKASDRAPEQARPITLAPDTMIMAGQSAIAANCIKQLVSNIAPFCDRRDPEGLHQAHIATRRLRTMVRIFRPMVPAAQSPAWLRIDATLQQLGQRMGEARDCDLLLASDGIPTRTAWQLRAAAAAHHRAICATVGNPYFRADMVTLLTTRGRRPASCDLAAWAGGVLDRLMDRLHADGRHLADQPPEQQHRVRIRTKRLRYAMEFFASLYRRRRQRCRYNRLLKHVSALQDSLGRLNDLATLERVLGIGHCDGAEARGGLAARAQAQLALVMHDKPFWR
jgi:triphosphatase